MIYSQCELRGVRHYTVSSMQAAAKIINSGRMNDQFEKRISAAYPMDRYEEVLEQERLPAFGIKRAVPRLEYCNCRFKEIARSVYPRPTRGFFFLNGPRSTSFSAAVLAAPRAPREKRGKVRISY